MKINEINKEIQKLNLENPQKSAILQLIDIKMESDMKEVIMEIRKMEAMMESKFDVMDSKFDAMVSKFDAKFDTIDTKFDAMDSKISINRWLLGLIAISILGLAFTIITRMMIV